MRLTPMIVTLAIAPGAATLAADTLHVPADHPSIQAAIDAATDGDTIFVSPGTWIERLDLAGKDLTIRGDGAAHEVVLRSPDGGTMLELDGDTPPTPIFADLTFTGGVDATLIRVGRGSPRFERCLFRDNLRQAFTESGSCSDTDGSTFADCLFIDNEEPNGGAVRVNQSNSQFVRCAFVDNAATGSTSGVNAGGALYIDDWTCGTHRVVMQDCWFEGNSAVWGGVIYVQGLYPAATFQLDVENCIFRDNSASQGRSIWSWYTTLRVTDSSFCGGGDQIRNSWTDLGGNAFSNSCESSELDDCDGDRVPDSLAINLGLADDCNGDGRPDACTAGDPKIDADGDGIPDVCQTPPCIADLSGNGLVDGGDLGIWLALAGNDCQSDPGCPADLNGDGIIDGADIGVILGAWGPCPD